jgi:hypothetical protein
MKPGKPVSSPIVPLRSTVKPFPRWFRSEKKVRSILVAEVSSLERIPFFEAGSRKLEEQAA